MRVLVPDPLFDEERELLAEHLAARGHEAVFTKVDPAVDAALLGGEPLDGERLAAMPRLRVVVRYARGRFDLRSERAALAAAGIAGREVGGGSAEATAEHALALTLALLRRLPEACAAAAGGRWEASVLVARGLRDLSEATVGLVGLGRVGRRFATLLAPFGPRLLYHQRRRLAGGEEESLGIAYRTLDELLAASDVVSLQTRGGDRPILGAREIARLRPGAILINVGDGRHVDFPPLAEALARGAVAAGLDVFPEEPFEVPAALRGRPNLLVTPHVAGRSRAATRSVLGRACAALEGEQPAAPGPHLSPLAALAARFASTRVLDPLVIRLGHESRAFAGLPEALTALGGRVEPDRQRSAPLAIGSDGAGELRIVLSNEDPASRETAIVLLEIPGIARAIERRWIDHDVWARLLPREARGSLPGRRLTIEGYGGDGPRLAWRAREIGLQVTIVDRDPRRRLEAALDGFDTAETAALGTLHLRGEVPPSFDLGQAAPELAATIAAAAVLALVVWRTGGPTSRTGAMPEIIHRVDRELAALQLASLGAA